MARDVCRKRLRVKIEMASRIILRDARGGALLRMRLSTAAMF